MRDNVRAVVAAAAAAFDAPGPVYEFGSYQVAGQAAVADLRGLFPGKAYVGCDMRPGPGVDQIEDLACLSLPDESVGTIVCVETLEHVFEVRRAVNEMLRVLRPGGLIIVTTPFEFHIHDHPSDYWRLTPSCLTRLFSPLAATIIGSQGPETTPHTVFGLACKAPVPAAFAAGASRFVAHLQAALEFAARREPWTKRWRRRLTGWLRSKGERRREREYHLARFYVDFGPSSADLLTAAGNAPSWFASPGVARRTAGTD